MVYDMKKNTRRPSRPSRQRGFTLLEVLITMVILSVGLLGVANLQLLGLNYNNNAYHRSQAVQLAYDIIERMRMNSAGVTAGTYSGGTAANSTMTLTFGIDGFVTAVPTLASPPTCDTTNFCTAADLATYDLNQWSDSINTALPNLEDEDGDPTTMARITALSGNRYSVLIQWGEKVEGAVDSNKVFEDNFEARNFTTFVQLPR